MKDRIGLKIKCALLRNSKGIIMEGKTEKRKQRNTQFKISNTSKAHKRKTKANLWPITKILNSWFNSYSECGCIWLSLVLLLWDFWGKNICLQQSNNLPFNHLGQQMVWRLLQERGHCRLNFLHQFARHVKAYDNICLVYTKLHALSYGNKLSLFFGGPYRFTWFGAFFNTIGPSFAQVV